MQSHGARKLPSTHIYIYYVICIYNTYMYVLYLTQDAETIEVQSPLFESFPWLNMGKQNTEYFSR